MGLIKFLSKMSDVLGAADAKPGKGEGSGRRWDPMRDLRIDGKLLSEHLMLKKMVMPTGMVRRIRNATPQRFRADLDHGEFQGFAPHCTAHVARVAASQYGVRLATQDIVDAAAEIQEESAKSGLHPVAAGAAVQHLTDGLLLWGWMEMRYALPLLWSGFCPMVPAFMSRGMTREHNDFVTPSGPLLSKKPHALLGTGWSPAVVHKTGGLWRKRSRTVEAVRLYNPWPTVAGSNRRDGNMGWWGREAWMESADMGKIGSGPLVVFFYENKGVKEGGRV